MQNEKPVAVQIAVPIIFRLSGDKDVSDKTEENKTKIEVQEAYQKNQKETHYKIEVQEIPINNNKSGPKPIGGFTAIQKNLVYPKIARQAGIEGTVTVQILINEEGEVTETEIIKSLGNNECNEAAIEALKATKWKPLIVDGKPEKVKIHVPVVFKLNADKTVNREVLVDFFDERPEPVGGMVAIQRNLIYPETARKAGVAGTVLVQAIIDANGNITDAVVIKSIGNDDCDQAAIEALKATTWKPAYRDGEAVKVKIAIPVVFKLSNDELYRI
jgi:TonB family protein